MLFKRVSTAFIAVACGALVAEAQGVREIPAPRELPPASFAGQQYVDSRGCIFVRAGFDGQTRWVPRVGNDRKVLCGYPPSLVQVPVAAEPPVAVAPAQPAPKPPAAVAKSAPAKPVRTASATPAPARAVPQSRTTQVTAAGANGCPVSAPVAERFPLRGGGTAILCLSRAGLLSDRAVAVTAVASPQVRVATGPAPRTELVCPGSAPSPRRFTLTDGGTTVLCTQGDGTLNGLMAPYRRPVADSRLAAAPTEPSAAAAARAAPAPSDLPAIPKGYVAAWNDDRLNPNRGKGTAAGQAAQDRIWTRETPARLVSEVAQPRRAAQQVTVSSKAQAEPQAIRRPVQVSTKSEPASQGGAAAYVQVGSFGQPANAEGARARLAALGLPVASGTLRSGGKSLQVIYAGPFADAGAARAALAAARRAGFSDAFLR